MTTDQKRAIKSGTLAAEHKAFVEYFEAAATDELLQ